MKNQPQHPEFRIYPENFHPCTLIVFLKEVFGYVKFEKSQQTTTKT